MNAIRVLILDDHPTVRMGITKLLENKHDIVVCGEASTAQEALKIIEKESPHLVLVDIGLDEDMSGLEFIKAVSRRYPEIRLLVHSMYDEAVYADRAIRAGARGYIQKNEAPASIVDGIKNVMKGDLVLHEKVKDRIIFSLMQGGRTSNENEDELGTLTNRELEIFQLFGRGKNIKEISAALNLSQNTIETHRRNIREKLNLESNNHLIRLAVQWISEHQK